MNPQAQSNHVAITIHTRQGSFYQNWLVRLTAGPRGGTIGKVPKAERDCIRRLCRNFRANPNCQVQKRGINKLRSVLGNAYTTDRLSFKSSRSTDPKDEREDNEDMQEDDEDDEDPKEDPEYIQFLKESIKETRQRCRALEQMILRKRAANIAIRMRMLSRSCKHEQ